ncbi:DUF4403 family protein [Elizabethkingia argentiflava]|uniref:DUF4403 family protein n=1 Tax=Elizabethkingia argenteiflava TaxID=2681556 RepID=A0A845PUC2_9FLAO|nr:DUF4403 family protein [Elizabethkingia argenteiflava]NAW50077.1 DUF4403 family protein [Elizabethkingia argenteiflava]
MRTSFLMLLFSIYSFGQEAIGYDFPKIKSSISIPVVVPMQEINRVINQTIKGVIYEDNSYVDNNNDQFKTKVEKDGNILVRGLTQNRLLISIPLKIWAEKGYGSLGYYTYQSTNFSVVMNFICKLGLNNNWTLHTQTQAAGFVWKDKPVLDYGKVKIPITSFVESPLIQQQQKFTKIIDQQVLEKMNMQPYLKLAWNQFINPIPIAEEYNTWLKISPISLSATPLKVYADQIAVTLGVDLYSETFTGNPPLPDTPVKVIPNFVSKPSIDDVFIMQTTVHIPFSEATKLAEQQFLHKAFTFREGSYKIVVEDIKVYEKNKKIVIEATTKGTVSGISTLTGTPIYDAKDKKIRITNTQYELKTSNFLQKALLYLFKYKIINMIEKEYAIPTKELESSAIKNIETNLNKEYYPGLFIKGKVFEFKPSDFVVNFDGINVILEMKAHTGLLISGLSF